MCSKQRRAKKRARSSARKILRNSGMGKFRHALPSSAKSYFLAKSPLKSTGPNGGEFCVLLVKTEHCRKNVRGHHQNRFIIINQILASFSSPPPTKK
uniref:Ribosomal protein L32 n=1 Tax=Globodera rostochiensis TaxID=31243 RepID=A0A914HZ85_GLORO